MRMQGKFPKVQHPVVVNVCNFAKGTPALLSYDDARTLFHEFGHALHGLFSDVRYPYFTGTSVPRDFVEYPSQVNEMWATWPEVLKHYAVHHETGEPMPTELLDKVLATATFNQGFATTEYLAASLLDMAWHQLTADEVPDADGLIAFEAAALEEAGGDIDDQGLYQVDITLNGPGGTSQRHSVLMYRGQGGGANGISRSRVGSSRNSRNSRSSRQSQPLRTRGR